MKEFMLIFRANIQSEEDFAKFSPEAMQQELALWGVWMGSIAQQGKMISGHPLQSHGKVLRGTAKKLTDGPFMESKEIVGGYLLIKATDEHDALEMAKGCPSLRTDDGTVEVREIMPAVA
ncbi:MAG: hypothetical protein IAF08_03910 [Rhizobacter sp.]|nr:hypothetical protein [Chlorobiales bacterium]